MRLRGHLRKETLQALRDPFGLAVALAAPVGVVWVFSQVSLGEVRFGPAFSETSPVALVLGLAVWLSNLSTASAALYRERVAGTLERLRATPFSPEILVASKAAILGALGLLQAGAVWGAARLLVPGELAAGDSPALLGVLALLALAAVAAGLLLATLLPSPTQLANSVTFLTLAVISLSGFFKPVAQLGTLRPVAAHLPFTVAYQEVRRLVADQGAAPAASAVLLLEALVLLALAALALRLGSRLRTRG